MKRYLVQPCVVALLAMTMAATAWAKDRPFWAEGAHRMVQVVVIANHSDIMQGDDRWVYDTLISQGVSDFDIRAGSIARGRVYCCRPDAMQDQAFIFYAGPDTPLVIGDIVEIRLGRKPEPKKKDRGTLSTAVKIRQSTSDSGAVCRWLPKDEGMWMRVLFCDWMESEGWVYQKGLFNTWYKPISTTANKRQR